MNTSTADRRATLATELLDHLDTLRALHRLAVQQEQAIRATWAALQACEAEPAAQGAGRQMGA